MGIAGQSPACDGADQGLHVGEGGDEERDELRKMRQHARHTALGHCPQGQDGGLLHQPVLDTERRAVGGASERRELLVHIQGIAVEAIIQLLPVWEFRCVCYMLT